MSRVEPKHDREKQKRQADQRRPPADRTPGKAEGEESVGPPARPPAQTLDAGR